MKPATRLSVALAVATVLAFVLGARGFDQFFGVRSKVVNGIMPARDGAVHLTVEGRGTLARLTAPFAVITRLANASAASASFTVTVDGRTICTPRLSAKAEGRIDCVVQTGWAPAESHTIDITSQAPAWSLNYLELASHHGASTGPVQLALIPKGATPFSPPTVVDVVVFWVACVGLFLLPWPARMPWAVAVAYRVAAAAILVLLAALIVVPWVSAYAVIVSWATLARLALVLVTPALWRLATIVVARLRDRRSAWAALGRPALIGALAVLPFVVVMENRLERTYLGNYSGFVQIGRVFADNSPYIAHVPDVRRTLVMVDGGYDGQFMYYAAWDPLLRAYRADPSRFEGLMDTPPYRFGRIGYVWLTWLGSFGDWHRFPKTMVWLDVVAIFICAVALAVASREAGASVFWGLLALLVPAFWQSMETTLPEPVAAAFLLLAYLAFRRRAWVWTGGLLAASLLVRETGLTFVAVVLVTLWLRKERRPAMVIAALALAPFALWHFYVGWVLYSGWGLQGFFFKPQLLSVPFMGFFDLWAHVRSGQYEMGLAHAAVWLPLILTAAWVLAVVAAVQGPRPLTVAAALYATIAVSLNYGYVWVHTRNGERVTYEVFVLLALVSAEYARRSPRWRAALIGFWALAGIYIFWIGFDGEFYRQSLVPFWYRM